MLKRAVSTLVLFFVLIGGVATASTPPDAPPVGASPVLDRPAGPTDVSQPEVHVSYWEGPLDPQTSFLEVVDFTVTYDASWEPIQVDFDTFAIAASWPNVHTYTCYAGSALHSVDFSTTDFLQGPGGQHGFYSAEIIGLDYWSYGVGAWILSPMTATGNLEIDYRYHDDEGATRIDGCDWWWTATCIENCRNPGEFEFSQAGYQVHEAEGDVTVTVVRRVGSDGEASVIVSTSEDTASEPDDYTGVLGPLTFASGETQKTFTIDIHDDDEDEGLEGFDVTLSSPTNGAGLGAQSSARVVIDDREECDGVPDHCLPDPYFCPAPVAGYTQIGYARWNDWFYVGGWGTINTQDYQFAQNCSIVNYGITCLEEEVVCAYAPILIPTPPITPTQPITP